MRRKKSNNQNDGFRDFSMWADHERKTSKYILHRMSYLFLDKFM